MRFPAALLEQSTMSLSEDESGINDFVPGIFPRDVCTPFAFETSSRNPDIERSMIWAQETKSRRWRNTSGYKGKTVRR
jgi:hypothetical protein